MKTILLVFLFLCTTNSLCAQETISSSGGKASAGNATVNYTVGQLVVETVNSSKGVLVQGVQQNIELFTLSNKNLKTVTLSAKMFPNPTKDKIMLSLLDTDIKGFTYSMFDTTGKNILNGKVNNSNTSIAMRNLATGIYILKVSKNKKQLKVFKIIKN